MAQRQFRSDDTSTWSERFGNGSNGALTISSNTTESPIDSAATGTGGTTSLTATNASFASEQLILIHQTYGTGAGNWELNKISSYVAGTITTSYSLINTYGTGAQVRVLPQYTNVTINSSTTYTAKAWNGTVGGILAFIANGSVTVTGSINGAGLSGAGGVTAGGAGIGFRGGDSASNGVGDPSQYGDGTTGNKATSSSGAANGNGGGGAKGGSSGVAHDGAGGSGGHASTGGNGTGNGPTYNGTGGSTAGNAGLTSMVFGGGGGGGSNRANDTALEGSGGGGGGIILIIGATITVTGSISVNGGTGWAADGAGGSGAGGSVLLKAQTATLGTNLITSTGVVASGSRGASSDGRIHIDYLTSFTGTSNPTIDSRQDATLLQASSGGTNNYAFFI